MRGATVPALDTALYPEISTHAPLARCDRNLNSSNESRRNFNSRTSCEVRRSCSACRRRHCQFQLTHLLRGATCLNFDLDGYSKFQLTHLLRGATYVTTLSDSGLISTHAPLARCDIPKRVKFGRTRKISTHAPLARCDLTALTCGLFLGFQLTHLLRGATSGTCNPPGAFQFQLTHLLRGATTLCHITSIMHKFQLTHLLRGATFCRTEKINANDNFNSRTSCEVRHRDPAGAGAAAIFQLTHLLRGATARRVRI